MTSDTSIGLDDPHDTKESGIDDEKPASVGKKPDLTREDIEAGNDQSQNDRNASADQGNRSGRTNKLNDDTIDIGKP